MINNKESDLINKARDFYNRGKYKEAKILLNDIIDSNGKSAEAFYYLGNIFHIDGEIGKAIKAFNKVLELDPCHTDASISLSILYNDIGKYEEGKKIFDQTNERIKSRKTKENVEDRHINKKFAEKHYELAEMYMSYNRYDEALYEYNKVNALNPEHLETRIKVAKVYSKKGFVSKAFDELRKLKTENPGFIPARIALGILFYGNGKVLEAQNEWRNVLVKDPYNSEAKMYLNLSETATETSIT
ncbi:MAG: hypothetical protein A2381_11940 [Bdellovibrionales bacterium RIFOXYB1_FULL_37_110]|nr:MAG: hypothetical protein A2181_01665 [Bdellovibrionales bacterium RIFOXYA1_FULL_38_20]OFZ52209.1 MAG: hypothetical protein A2417_05785 [Bdellovibrionales bacterium RIFOXYC1_FULL_37_79]OFZ57195.1 MAG: hypothetical protein A2381_11940 [Bdellovibrionales bacterium RIFOXYB1_FULL_37_110]OFZ65197.1 MAG: hypothetical protein A2577_04375 [Bdellovibrionales bacterium RIFOXYD1_FULL_36_51]